MPNYLAPLGSQFIFYIELTSQADTKLFQVNPTIAAGDFKLSQDGGAFANLVNLPVVTPAGGRAVKFIISSAEMNATNILVQCVDAAGTEWCDAYINIQTNPVDANMTRIDGVANISATLNLTKLNIVNSGGPAIVATSTGSNGAGLQLTGNGSGPGFLSTGGSTGNGGSLVGGGTSGNGLNLAASTNGKGLNLLGVGSGNAALVATGGANGDAAQFIGTGSGTGFVATGGLTGHGAALTGGATSGNGANLIAVGSGVGLNTVGVGGTSILAAQGISGALDTAVYTSIADALLKRDMSSVTGEASRSLLNCLRFIRNKWSISGSTMTITKEDDSTSAWTGTVTTDANALPVIQFVGN